MLLASVIATSVIHIERLPICIAGLGAASLMGSPAGVDQVGVDSETPESMPPPGVAGWTDGGTGDGGGVIAPSPAPAPATPKGQGQVRTPFLLVGGLVVIAAVVVLLVG